MTTRKKRDALIGTVLDGYRLTAVRGSGSFAIVYHAAHTRFGREAAVKIMDAAHARDPALRERFRREAASMAKIVHPNVVQVFGSGELVDHRPYLIMEWVRGKTLAHEIEKKGPMSPERAANILRGTARGLAAAHALRLIHRDLKASNLMLNISDHGDEESKILDFGLVRVLADDAGPRLTREDQLLGTPQNIAPEIIQGGEPSPASDLYALGVILFEMLTGRSLFEGSIPAILKQHVKDAVPAMPPSGGLERIALHLLAKSPSDRPRSALDLISELDELALTGRTPDLPSSEMPTLDLKPTGPDEPASGS